MHQVFSDQCDVTVRNDPSAKTVYLSNSRIEMVLNYSDRGLTTAGFLDKSSGKQWIDNESGRSLESVFYSFRDVSFGSAGDLPVVGDWDGDGSTELGVFNPSASSFYLDYDGDGKWSGADKTYVFGQPGDLPVAGDWDGDGKAEIGVFRNGSFFLDYDGDGSWGAADKTYMFGQSGDLPVAGDWDGDGLSEIGVFNSGGFYLDHNGDGDWDPGVDKTYQFGMSGDLPFSGDWNGDGNDSIGVFRPATGSFYLDANGNGAWDIPGDTAYFFNGWVGMPVALKTAFDSGPGVCVYSEGVFEGCNISKISLGDAIWSNISVSLADYSNSKLVSITARTNDSSNLNYGLEVTKHYQMFSGLPVVREWLSIRNAGQKGLLLKTNLRVLDLNVNFNDSQSQSVILEDVTDSTNELAVYHNAVDPRVENYLPGTVFRMYDSSNDGLWIYKEAPTHAYQTEMGYLWGTFEGSGHLASVGDRIEIIRPGENVDSFSTALGVYSGSLYDYYSEIQRYLMEIYPEKESQHFIQSEHWGNIKYQGMDSETNLMAEIDNASRVGIERIMIDPGWFDETGYSQAPSNRTFPNGFKAVSDYATEKNIALGTWLVLQGFSEHDPLILQHPEYLARQFDGTPILWGTAAYPGFYPPGAPDTNLYLLDFTTPVKGWYVQWFIGLYDLYGISFHKLDGFNIAPAGNSSYYDQYSGILEVLDEVQRQRPEIAFEIDLTGYKSRFQTVSQKYGACFFENRFPGFTEYVPHSALDNFWEVSPYIRTTKITTEFFLNKSGYSPSYLFATSLAGQPLLFDSPIEINESQMMEVKPLIDLWKEYRSDFYSGIIVPVGEKPRDGKTWTGFESYNRTTNTGFLLLYRQNVSTVSYDYTAPYLWPGTYYVFDSVSDGTPPIVITGEEKLRITLPTENSYRIYRFYASTTSTTSSTTTTSTTTTTTLPCIMPGNYPDEEGSCDEVTLSEIVNAINLWAVDAFQLANVVNLINSWADPSLYPPI